MVSSKWKTAYDVSLLCNFLAALYIVASAFEPSNDWWAAIRIFIMGVFTALVFVTSAIAANAGKEDKKNG